MKPEFRPEALKQIKQFIDSFQELQFHWDQGITGNRRSEDQELLTAGRALVNRIAGPESSYAKDAEEIIARIHENPRIDLTRRNLRRLFGVVMALREAVLEGWLSSREEFLHGEIFADYLEMATHLLNERYKDAAAVISGSTLEAHLRQLCHKHGVPTEMTKHSGS